ncbi:polyketide synthase docking domain-containing protein, partial [Lipingzhangella rawalii]
MHRTGESDMNADTEQLVAALRAAVKETEQLRAENQRL